MRALLLRFAPHLGLAAVLALAGLGLALKAQTTRLGKARAVLALETALHATDIANFRAAQARADADWQTQLTRLASINRRQKDDADRKADAAITLYRDRVLRLPAVAPDAGASDAATAGLPGSGFPRSLDQTGADTVVLARADALICAENSARLRIAHDWAQALRAGSVGSIAVSPLD